MESIHLLVLGISDIAIWSSAIVNTVIFALWHLTYHCGSVTYHCGFVTYHVISGSGFAFTVALNSALSPSFMTKSVGFSINCGASILSVGKQNKYHVQTAIIKQG